MDEPIDTHLHLDEPRYTLRELRESLGLSVLALSNETGITYQRLYNWDYGRGYATPEELETLAEYFHVAPQQLRVRLKEQFGRRDPSEQTVRIQKTERGQVFGVMLGPDGEKKVLW